MNRKHPPLPIPTVEQAEALIVKCNDPSTSQSAVAYLLRLGCITFLAKRRHQKSPAFQRRSAINQLRKRVRTMSLDEQRDHLKKWEGKLSKATVNPGDTSHYDRYEKLLGKVMALRRAYATRLGYMVKDMDGHGLATIVEDTETHELRKELEA